MTVAGDNAMSGSCGRRGLCRSFCGVAPADEEELVVATDPGGLCDEEDFWGTTALRLEVDALRLDARRSPPLMLPSPWPWPKWCPLVVLAVVVVLVPTVGTSLEELERWTSARRLDGFRTEAEDAREDGGAGLGPSGMFMGRGEEEEEEGEPSSGTSERDIVGRWVSMFKKPLGSLKTSAPLRSSDRRRLRQRVVEAFSLNDGDELVPDGILAVRFTTHLGDPGTAYLSPAPGGDPLWFTLGKGQSDELIPTVYTLWKRPNLLPSISTPASVIPVLVGGADLMIPGVVQHPSSLQRDRLVSITRDEHGRLGPPFAVGRMAVDIDGGAIRAQGDRSGDGKKGKAVNVLHTWKDALFDQGSKSDPPESVAVEEEDTRKDAEQGDEESVAVIEDGTAAINLEPPPIAGDEPSADPPLSPQEVSELLRTSLIHAIRYSLSKASPQSPSFPMPSTILYSSHILPSRPAFCQNLSTSVDIKHSTHKSLTAFLRTCEKEGLVKLKETKSDVVVMGIFPQHEDVLSHKRYETLKDVEMKKEKREEAEEAERSKVKEMVVKELWKPRSQTIGFFEETGNSTTALYTQQEIRNIVNEYVRAKGLTNARDAQYVNVDELLATTLASSKKSEVKEQMEFLKRNEIVDMITERMQSWYEVTVEGKKPVLKKGQLQPISVLVKTRQGGRKATTTVSHYEPFMITSEALADELQRMCASATSVTTLPGSEEAVVVQGKQTTAVCAVLVSRGVPKRWIR